MIFFFRSGRDGSTVDSAQQQHINLLTQSLKQMQERYDKCSSDLASERRSIRGKHESLVGEIANLNAIYERAEADLAKVRENLTAVESSKRSEIEVLLI